MFLCGAFSHDEVTNMNEATLEYLKSLKPAPHPDGNALVREGREMGRDIPFGLSRFRRETGWKSFLEYRKQARRDGRICWNILIGLATLEEELDGIGKLAEFSKRTGMTIDMIQPIPSGLVAVPKAIRDKAPATTSYVLDGFDQYKAHVEAAPIEVTFNDYHLASPTGLETTIHAIRAGSSLIGEFSQIIWGYPGCDDDLGRFCDMMKALGIIASKHDEEVMVKTYLDDGYAGYFVDCASYIAYAMLEHYICTELCGARYFIAYGGLLSEMDTRMGIALALDKVLSTEDQPALYYINSSTNLQWDHDIHGNYGMSIKEFLFEILVEKKYRMGLGINPVSITEKIAVPTLRELLDILAAGKRTEENAEAWLPYMDFTKLEEMRDVMVEQGTQMYHNILEGFEAAGIDTHDPLELVMVLRKFNPLRFEQMFHPSTYRGANAELVPFYPTVLGRQTVKMRDDLIEQARQERLGGCLKGKKLITVSGDAHTYGLMLVEGVLNYAGASIVNGGVDVDAADLLDLADEEGTDIVCVSCHNGQALDYGRQLIQLAAERRKHYLIFMGGLLNAILPGDSEPTIIADRLEALGINAGNDILQTLRVLKEA